MNNIIWLASYPKSGNTWFRVFLTNLVRDGNEPADINQLESTSIASSRSLFDDAVGIEAADLSHLEVDRLRPEVYRYLSAQAKEDYFLKIHDAYTYVDDDPANPLVPPDATKVVIYIMRNPLDVAISLANHSGIAIDLAIRQMATDQHAFSRSKHRLHHQLRQRLLSWSGHVLSWIDAPGLDVHVMRYEDMKRNPRKTFATAIQFAGIRATAEQVEKALHFSHISEMQKQEKEYGFKEKPIRSQSFFRKGEVGDWRNVLEKHQVDEILNSHRETMHRFGYLDKQGHPVDYI